jgi:hypothetical protein
MKYLGVLLASSLVLSAHNGVALAEHGDSRDHGGRGGHRDHRDRTTLKCIPRGNRLVLRFSGSGHRLRGREKLNLKQLLRSKCSLVRNLYRNKSLEEVKLLARSSLGFGKARLQVGSNFGYPQRIGRGQGRLPFDRVFLPNPKQNDYGPWMLWFKGRIKLKKIVLFFSERHDKDHWDF